MPTVQEIKTILQTGNSSSDQTPVHPEEFCHKWIEQLYGVSPGEDLYRKTCIVEMTRFLAPSGVVAVETAYRNWKWQNGQKKFPSYLPAFLALIDRHYTAISVLGSPPKYPRPTRGDL